MNALMDVHAAIAAADEQFVTTFRQRDAAGLAGLYTRNGQLLPPNAPIMTGAEAIQGFWQAVLDSGVQDARLDITEVTGYGETAVEVGRWTMFGPEQHVLDQGKYIVVWQQEDGQWKLHRDIFNSSTPAPGA